MQKSQKGAILTIVIIIVLAVIVVGGYLIYKQNFAPEKSGTGTQTGTPTPSATPTPTDQTAGWKTYIDDEQKISFKYPSNWRVIPNYYTTAAGIRGRVGDTITFSNLNIPPDNERIDIGGHQVDCESLKNLNREEHPAGVLCKTIYPIYTFSTDPEVIRIFNIIADTISELQSKNETAGWKTYTNTQYGFEIKYPADGWNLLVDTPRGNFLHLMQIGAITESDDFAGSVQLYIQSGNVDSWLSNKATHTRETVYINGLRAEKFYFGRDLKTDTSLTYVFERNNLVYVINTVVVIGNKYGISETDISQILSTFKFTTPTDQTAGWIDCNNSKYSFTLKLPPSLFSGCYINEVAITPGSNLTNPYGITQISFSSVNSGPERFTIVVNSQENAQLEGSTKYLGTNNSLYFYLDSYGCCQGNSEEVKNIINNKIAPTFKFTTPTTQPSITVISPNGGELWQIGTTQTIKYSLSTNWTAYAGTCVDAFLIDSNGNKTSLKLGKYINVGGYIFTFKLVSADSTNAVNIGEAKVSPGTYKVEVNAHYCAESNNAFIALDRSDNYFTITK